MKRDFVQHPWGEAAENEARRIIGEALREDLSTEGDITSLALIDADRPGRAAVVSREEGILAGEPIAAMVLEAVDKRLKWSPAKRDGQPLAPGETLGVISGPVRSMLTAERPILNIIGRLSGIATLTARYVAEIAGTSARVYDTRKTTPGWRFLEKYAVHCGGGRNHRTGLFDAMLIKDNHLASVGGQGLTPADALRRGRAWLQERFGGGQLPIIEVEVDSLDQLKNVLEANPDIVLLDNMPPEMMAEAVALRNSMAPETELEASGGINLETVRAKAASGVDRVSVGRLTHSPRTLDIGLDWQE
ncbi:MAG: carboxylating nicotinate-nucleotide diphosphorylase [Thermoguttaceae bacterium]|nr:carboxylating nicotinate-nucleotide diphosphorylase [Thermoguttaceae bacterium]MBQ6620420.1 carboxylating nicotinate-nucleotide diphosphorylase [Thermoguttaceae bacterium]